MTEMTARRYLAASQNFDKAIAFNKSFKEAYLQDGYASINMRQTDNALRLFTRVHELDPGNGEANRELMDLYYSYRQYPKAIEYAQKCISCPGAERIIAMSNFRMEDYGAAVKGLLSVIAKDPKDAEANYMLASSYLEMEDNKLAAQYYQKAIALDGTKNVWMNELGMLYYEINDFKKAVTYLSMAADHGFPQDGVSKENLGYAYLYSGDYMKGEKVLMDLWSKKPGNKDILRDMADAFYKLRMYDKSLEYCQKLLELDAKDGKALYQAGLCFQKKGQKEKGQAMCDNAIKLDPSLTNLKHKESLEAGL